jgi:hypothetical protein
MEFLPNFQLMAHMRNGINGAFSGRVATVVGYTRYGRSYMRSVPKKSTKPPSEKQLLNRQAMSVVQAWLKRITPCVRIGFQNYSDKQHGFGSALSYIKLNALNEDLTLDPSRAMIAWGPLSPPLAAIVVNPESGVLEFNWEPEKNNRDRVMVLAYANGQDPIWDVCGAQRSEGKHALYYGDNLSGQQADLYMAFVSEERDECSNSVYMGTLVLL